MGQDIVTELKPLPVVLLAWRPIRKGSLLGFASVRLGKSLQINDISVCRTGDRLWASLPSKPVLTRDGAPKVNERGKAVYSPILQWTDPASRDRFSEAVVAIVQREHAADLAAGTAP